MSNLTVPGTVSGGSRCLTPQQAALLSLGKALQAADYRFVAPTPLTCARILNRPSSEGADLLRDVFGWNRPFEMWQLDPFYQALLSENCLVETTPQGQDRSLVRFSTLDGLLFAHSGYPTEGADFVFFGPDTYRFAHAIRSLFDCAPGFSPGTIIDIGAGTGAGGLFAARLCQRPPLTVLTDINPKALLFCEVNAAINDMAARLCQSDVLEQVEPDGDLIISNPPYLVDPAQRAYRHGGGDWGCSFAVRILSESLDRMTPNGRFLLYTGTPVVDGVDMFLEAALPVLSSRVRDFHYEEQDPDVFGEELENAPYDRAERIATAVLHVKGADILR